MAGRIHQINVSAGGVPKLPVEQATITAAGVEGDAQANLDDHGGPDRAVCLYSLEVIRALQDEGHPIQPGNAGENLTISGIDWTEVRPGRRLRSGTLVLEITAPTAPCAKNARWFVDGAFGRMHDGRYPGWSRMYARVLEPGRVATGDGIEMLDVTPGPS